MATKERYENPVPNDTVNLRYLQFNGNQSASVNLIDRVEIFFLDPFNRSVADPDGRRLVQIVTAVVENATGEYVASVAMPHPQYVIGKYIDKWYVQQEEGEPVSTTEFSFEVYADKWYAAPEPYVFNFGFAFRPNKFRQGEQRWIVVELTPNVAHASDLERYYADLAVTPSLFVTVSLRCGDCVPVEQDLRTVIERQPVQLRNKKYGQYFFDTTELDCGIYDIWFDLEFGGNKYISPRNQLQIFD